MLKFKVCRSLFDKEFDFFLLEKALNLYLKITYLSLFILESTLCAVLYCTIFKFFNKLTILMIIETDSVKIIIKKTISFLAIYHHYYFYYYGALLYNILIINPTPLLKKHSSKH